jgi:hypothetical protein
MTPEMKYLVQQGPANLRQQFAEIEHLPEEKQRHLAQLLVIAALIVMTLIAWLQIARYSANAHNGSEPEVFRFGQNLLIAPTDRCSTIAFGPSK